MKSTEWDDIRQSLFNLLDHKLLENGAYVNITTGTTDTFGNNSATFRSVTDSELFGGAAGHIFQSSFHNFVYESGVLNQPSPTLISGVYVDGIFTPKSSNLEIDYVNGRAIFNTAISTSSVVRANFSYKEYSFVRPDNSDPFKNKSKYISNSEIEDSPSPASPNLIYLPAIFIEVDRGSEVEFQFGGTNETLPSFRLAIVSDNLTQVEGIASVFLKNAKKAFCVRSITAGPKFNFFNNLIENYSFYEWCASPQYFGYLKSVKYNRFFDVKTESSQPKLFGGIVNVEISAIR
jgi:hypothetical protein